MLHGRPETLAERAEGVNGSNIPASPSSASGAALCPECSKRFDPAHPNSIFCSDPHKQAWHNRQSKRGRTLTSLAMAARQTRDGSRGDTATGTYARQASRQLLDRWVREDREKKRMSATDYIRLRRSKGFDI